MAFPTHFCVCAAHYFFCSAAAEEVCLEGILLLNIEHRHNLLLAHIHILMHIYSLSLVRKPTNKQKPTEKNVPFTYFFVKLQKGPHTYNSLHFLTKRNIRGSKMAKQFTNNSDHVCK